MVLLKKSVFDWFSHVVEFSVFYEKTLQSMKEQTKQIHFSNCYKLVKMGNFFSIYKAIKTSLHFPSLDLTNPKFPGFFRVRYTGCSTVLLVGKAAMQNFSCILILLNHFKPMFPFCTPWKQGVYSGNISLNRVKVLEFSGIHCYIVSKDLLSLEEIIFSNFNRLLLWIHIQIFLNPFLKFGRIYFQEQIN